MSGLIVIDGNSIMNRAFYGIMGAKTLMTSTGVYSNGLYGFLSILFKIEEDLKPEYIAVAFDLKAPTARHKMYEGYKATRKGMPDELAQQMPIIKDILKAMNIKIIEKEGYEADDVLGTLARRGEKDNIDVTILTGDRDAFQLATDKVTIRIPRTKSGKTEVEDFNRQKVIETYGVEPLQLIEVKGLMGDTSDNIPGVPGVGEKTALNLIKEYKTILDLYNKIESNTDSIKGKLREKLVANKDLAILSRTLGTINVEVPIEEKIEDLKLQSWNNEEVLKIFKELRFNRYIERFGLSSETKQEKYEVEKITEQSKIKELIEKIKENKELFYYLESVKEEKTSKIIKEKIISISVYLNNVAYYIKINEEDIIKYWKEIFEDKTIKKYGFKLGKDYVLLKQIGISMKNLFYDAEIAAYVINPTNIKFTIKEIAREYLDLDLDEYLQNENTNKTSEQLTLFNDTNNDDNYIKYGLYAYIMNKLFTVTITKMKETNTFELFEKIEMPLVEVLAEMQYNGMGIDRQELLEFGNVLKEDLSKISKEIIEMAGEDFNINSTQQLGHILFEKLKLPSYRKTKKGYSTDVETLERLRNEHPIIEKILEYRALTKLNSTYVEGLIPYINESTNRIHSTFHQTITATGRLSSSDPNLQNIPTRMELGKKLRKVFKPQQGYIYIDADYSQIELRVLAHISQDQNMIDAFNNDEDIHKQAASKVFNIPIEEVTKEQRSSAKAVNFGIVYGISDFGLAEQLKIPKKQAKQYIEQYLEKYNGIKEFMDKIVEETKEKGYVETLFNRRRYIPELNSNNYMVRQFGARAAMNTPIQGTAADIMKIAMINVYKELQKQKLDAKIVLQVHDELMIEANINEKEQVKQILKKCMEEAMKMRVPLKVELSEALNWYEAK